MESTQTREGDVTVERTKQVGGTVADYQYECQNWQGQSFEVTLRIATGSYPVIVSPYLGDLHSVEFNRLANQVIQDFDLEPTNWVWITTLNTLPTISKNQLVEPVAFVLLDFYCYLDNAQNNSISTLSPQVSNATEIRSVRAKAEVDKIAGSMGWRVWWDGTYRPLENSLVQALLERLGK